MLKKEFLLQNKEKVRKYIKYLKLLEINAQIDNIVDAQGNLGTT